MLRILFGSVLIFLLSGCYKSVLEEKQNGTDVLLKDVRSLQALLDYTTFMNNRNPVLGEISSDQFTITDAIWSSHPVNWARNAYIWKADLYEGVRTNPCYDWAYPYQTVFYANIALEEAQNKQGESWNLLRGNAYFFRAHGFYQVLQLFAPVYEKSNSSTSLGIALRLKSGIDEATTRASVEESYQQVISDLKEAIALLPNTPLTNYRPSRPAAFALLARTYLSMGEYEKALQAANACLQTQNQLLDYKSISETPSYPMPLNNVEILFQATMYVEPLSLTSRTVDNALLNLYETGDRRRALYFRLNAGRMIYRGSYSGSSQNFVGPTTGEMYLVRAECLARKNDILGALADLDTLRKYRFTTPTFKPLIATTADQALDLVFQERSRELVSRGLRWFDLRRLSLDPKRKITLSRILAGTTYTLTPGDLRYVMPIPEEVIELTGIPQNIR